MFRHLFDFKGYEYQNTRQYLRLTAAWPVKLELKTEPAEYHVLSTKDVSAGGISVIAQQMIPVGSDLRVETHVPPLNRSISAEAKVVRCSPGRLGNVELGIRFLGMDPEDRNEIDQFIEEFYTPRERARQHKMWWRKVS